MVTLRKIKCGLFLLLFLIQILGLIYIITHVSESIVFIESLESSIKNNPYTTLTILFLGNLFGRIVIPGLFFNLLVNYVCIFMFSVFPGAIIGFFVSFISANIGNALSFLLSRYLFRSQVESCIKGKYNKMRAILKVIEKEGYKLVILLRMSPIPNFITNYGLAATKLSLFDYVVGSIGSIPRLCAGLYVAATLESIRENYHGIKTVDIILYILGGVSVIALSIIIGVKAKKEIDSLAENYDTDNEKNEA